MFTWTESTGGPLLVASPNLLLKWQGVGEWLPDCDYDAACAVDGYLGVLARHGGQVLVLADEPMPTTFMPLGGQLVLARWMYCPSKTMAEDLLTALPSRLPQLQSPLKIAHQVSAVALIDSASKGIEALSSAGQAALPAGEYVVTTEDYAGAEFRFVVHRFTRS